VNKQDRIEIQFQGDDSIRKARKVHVFISKTDSLFQKARKFGLAIDMPFNRATRRTQIKDAIKAERIARSKAA
jgi:hypothetical protein